MFACCFCFKNANFTKQNYLVDRFSNFQITHNDSIFLDYNLKQLSITLNFARRTEAFEPALISLVWCTKDLCDLSIVHSLPPYM